MKAFPQRVSTEYQYQVEHGMDLRDYFAAKAMQGMFANSSTQKIERKDLPLFALVCYEMADAMMKARKQNDT
jgi:hypothetical protein